MPTHPYNPYFNSRGNDPDQDQVALFIDWDNLVISNYADRGANRPNIEVIVQKAQQYGTVVIARAYAEWSVMIDRLEVYKAGVEPIYAPVFHSDRDLGGQTGKGKSLADPVMVTDCIDFLHLLPQVGTYVLVTGDKDMMPVVRLAKLRGRRVVVIGPDYVANVLQQVCDEFVPYRLLLVTSQPLDPYAAYYQQPGYYPPPVQPNYYPTQVPQPQPPSSNDSRSRSRRLPGGRRSSSASQPYKDVLPPQPQQPLQPPPYNYYYYGTPQMTQPQAPGYGIPPTSGYPAVPTPPPSAGLSNPPQGQGYPTPPQGYPTVPTPPQGQGYPTPPQGYPTVPTPPQGQGYPTSSQGYPTVPTPPQGQGYPTSSQGYPAVPTPPQGQGYPTPSQGYPTVPTPPQGQGYPTPPQGYASSYGISPVQATPPLTPPVAQPSPTVVVPPAVRPAQVQPPAAPERGTSSNFEEVKDTIRVILNSRATNGRGQMRARDLKEELLRRIPNFNERRYGYSKFKALLNAVEQAGILQMYQSGHILWVALPGTPKLEEQSGYSPPVRETVSPIVSDELELEEEEEVEEEEEEEVESPAVVQFEVAIAVPELPSFEEPLPPTVEPEETILEPAVEAPPREELYVPIPAVSERVTAIQEAPIGAHRSEKELERRQPQADTYKPTRVSEKIPGLGAKPILLEQPYYEDVILLIEGLRHRNRWLGYELLLSSVRDYLTKQMVESEAKSHAGTILSKLLNEGVLKMAMEVHSRGARKMRVQVAHLQEEHPSVRYAMAAAAALAAATAFEQETTPAEEPALETALAEAEAPNQLETELALPTLQTLETGNEAVTVESTRVVDEDEVKATEVEESQPTLEQSQSDVEAESLPLVDQTQTEVATDQPDQEPEGVALALQEPETEPHQFEEPQLQAGDGAEQVQQVIESPTLETTAEGTEAGEVGQVVEAEGVAEPVVEVEEPKPHEEPKPATYEPKPHEEPKPATYEPKPHEEPKPAIYEPEPTTVQLAVTAEVETLETPEVESPTEETLQSEPEPTPESEEVAPAEGIITTFDLVEIEVISPTESEQAKHLENGAASEAEEEEEVVGDSGPEEVAATSVPSQPRRRRVARPATPVAEGSSETMAQPRESGRTGRGRHLARPSHTLE